MDRLTVLNNLSTTERLVTQGEAHLESQRRIIARLERDGHPTEKARKLLRLFEETQALRVADRDRLREELGKTPARSGGGECAKRRVSPIKLTAT